ncbi:MAG: rRNA maturation RNase YbeY [Tannerellaceae bacterium]|jgi:rRNA maturation RNase YbeY|nr:rRNA maturation RNase YbeY [Tannerellaceae bacterium]
MSIRYYTEDTRFPLIKKRIVNSWIQAVASLFEKKTGTISYIFCSDEKILEINKQYLNHDYYTDIITFDYSEKNAISGDIFISTDTVKSNSEKYKTLYTEELHRTIIHGILHLCGIDDKGPGEREIMENYENKALLLLPEEAYKTNKNI